MSNHEEPQANVSNRVPPDLAGVPDIEFLAYLAGVNSSAKPLTISREGDGKLVLEFSSDALPQVLRLLGLADSALVVTVRPDA